MKETWFERVLLPAVILAGLALGGLLTYALSLKSAHGS